MPLYEFRCASCGERFEALVEVGTESVPCRLCGAGETVRMLSAQAAPFGLAGTPGSRRAQERRNTQLRQRARADFKAARRRARGPGGSEGR
jgi:putative FmdB family regulatory protein